MFRILLDEESVGAKQFALLVNEFDPGLTSKAHKHDKEEHAFYIISGTGIIRIDAEGVAKENGSDLGGSERESKVTRTACVYGVDG